MRAGDCLKMVLIKKNLGYTDLVRILQAKGMTEFMPCLQRKQYIYRIVSSQITFTAEVARLIEIALDIEPYSLVEITPTVLTPKVKERLIEIDRRFAGSE